MQHIILNPDLFFNSKKKHDQVVAAIKRGSIQQTNVHFLQASVPPSGPGSKEETSCEGQVLGSDIICNYIGLKVLIIKSFSFTAFENSVKLSFPSLSVSVFFSHVAT